MTLTEFLLARFKEDEETARKLLRYAQENELACREPQMLGKRIPGWHEWPDVQAMCVRTLAECEAKRGAIEAAWMDHRQIESEWGTGKSQEQMEATGDYPEVVQWLALPYADHPDYQQEWKP